MSLTIQDGELLELMEDFYTLTGIRLALFDEYHTELASYPRNGEGFCARMRQNESFDGRCRASDEDSFARCRQTGKMYIYQCHAGLIEATVPITEEGRIIGYMMLGQITDRKNRDGLFAELSELCRVYGVEEDMSSKIRKIKYRNERQIRAASKILDACTEYIRLKEIVKPSGEQLIGAIQLFVDHHIGETIDVDRICREFDISRTSLYDAIRPYHQGGIASFVRHRRLEIARRMIRTTELPIAEIASRVGFSDYNYFLRVFKQTYGISSKKLRFAKNGE